MNAVLNRLSFFERGSFADGCHCGRALCWRPEQISARLSPPVPAGSDFFTGMDWRPFHGS